MMAVEVAEDELPAVAMAGDKPVKPSPIDNLKNLVPTKAQAFKLVPIIDTVTTYDWRANAMDDIIAGITTGVMLIPQGMAYALVATLPPQYGLYSATVPIVVYAILGTSRQLAVGPVAIISLLVAEAIEPERVIDGISQTDEQMLQHKVQLASVLAFFVGVFSLALGLFRAGQLSTFLSHSVLVGFTGGASVVIAISQLKHVLGFDIPKSHYPVERIIYALSHLKDTNAATIAVGLIGIGFLLGTKQIKKRFTKPVRGGSVAANRLRKILGFICSLSALEAVIAATLVATYLFNSHGYTPSSLPIVGSVPAGLPTPAMPSFAVIGQNMTEVLLAAFVITILGFMESFAVADTYARKHGYAVEPNQELVALGASSLIGAFFHAYPVAGGFGRTAVNDSSGAKSPLASLISAGIVAIVCFQLTSLFYFLPKAILGAIILVAVSSLFDFHAFMLSWKVSKADFWVSVLTFTSTICLGTELGLALGVSISILSLLREAAFPHTASLGLVESADTGEKHWRNLSRFGVAKEPQGVLVFRADASLQFINRSAILAKLHAAIADKDFGAADTGPFHAGVILDCSGINSIDVAGVEALGELATNLKAKGLSLVAAAVKGPVRDVIDRENAFQARHRAGVMLFPWAKPCDPGHGPQRHPTSAMVASIDEGLTWLRKQPSNDDLESGIDVATDAAH